MRSPQQERSPSLCACCEARAKKGLHGGRLRIGDRYYELVATEVQAPDLATSLEAGLLLNFEVAPDEESASLRVLFGGGYVELGQRMHHYMLVTLARQRVADAAAGLLPDAQGWITRVALCAMLAIDDSHLNVLIFRARHQWLSSVPATEEMSGLVERQYGALRLCAVPFEIRRAGLTEARYSA